MYTWYTVQTEESLTLATCSLHAMSDRFDTYFPMDYISFSFSHIAPFRGCGENSAGDGELSSAHFTLCAGTVCYPLDIRVLILDALNCTILTRTIGNKSEIELWVALPVISWHPPSLGFEAWDGKSLPVANSSREKLA